MHPKGIGTDVGAAYGHLNELTQMLETAQAAHYNAAEIGISSLNLILNGRLIAHLTERVQEVTKQFDLHYTVHAPNRTNLAYGYDLDMDEAVLRACLEFCHAISADILVYHSGLQALSYVAHGAYGMKDRDLLKRGAENEITALRRLAPYAADLGVTIAMENGDTHLWEADLLRKNGLSTELLGEYHARLKIGPIVDQIKAVAHPKVRMTLDLAHLHIASHALGFNYLEAVSEAAPYVSHLHLNDNFGKLDAGFEDEGDQAPYGEADLHLPPSWGTIPFAEAFARLDQFKGYIIIELKHRYREYLAESRHTIAALSSFQH